MPKEINLGRVKGTDGKSPYQVATENGYTGTETEFNAALASMQNAPFLPLSIGRDGATVDIGGGLTLQTEEKSGTAVINITRDGTDFTGRVVFADNVSVPEPTDELHAVNKGYVDDLVGDINSLLDAINGEVV